MILIFLFFVFALVSLVHVFFFCLTSLSLGLASHTYPPETVQEIINYGWDRGVRVIPEFDTPGHSQAMGVGYPEVVTKCYKDGKPDGSVGPIYPIDEKSYSLLEQVKCLCCCVFFKFVSQKEPLF